MSDLDHTAAFEGTVAGRAGRKGTTMKLQPALRGMRLAATRSTAVFVRDIGHGLLSIGHSALALLGLAFAAVVLVAASRAEVRADAESWALSWLQARQTARAEPADTLAIDLSEPDAIARATATDPSELSRQQSAVARWLSTRYRVAPEPVSRLVQEAWSVGDRAKLDPTLILAVIAIESSFNPFAQSKVGAQGLMQVMTLLHNDKYEAFGGNLAAFDPVTNLRVGVQVLKECIARAGGLEAGLRFYVGAANLPDDGGYATRVLGEQQALRLVAGGKAVSPHTVLTRAAAPATLKPAAVSPPALPLPAQATPVKPESATEPDQVALAR